MTSPEVWSQTPARHTVASAPARRAVITGEVAGRVIRPDGLPQPDAQVVLAQRAASGTLRQLTWRARTAFDGRYSITGVPPGRYLVLVRAIGADVAVAATGHDQRARVRTPGPWSCGRKPPSASG